MQETNLRSQLSSLALFGSLFLSLCAVLFIVNQTAQAVALANTVSPLLGRFVLISLSSLFGVAILVPLVMIARMPTPLRPPPDVTSTGYENYLRQLGERLKRNPYLAGITTKLEDRTEIESALKALEVHADGIIKNTATSIFVSTAISQNGMLDALMVLSAQTRMIWQIARVYNQRPSIREMIRLYRNVGVTVFVASEIEDLDLAEQVEPIIKTALSSSIVSLVPGITSVASIVTQSIAEGTANAFLTLRVGIVCRTHCASIVAFDPKSTRRYASVTAAAMLGSIVGTSAAKVAKAMVAAAKKAGVATLQSTATGIREAGVRLNPFKARE